MPNSFGVRIAHISRWLEAVVVLWVVRLGLAWVPYARLLRLLERSAWTVAVVKHAESGWVEYIGARRPVAAQIVTAVRRARRLGVANVTCLEEALTIQWMLRRRGAEAQVQIGVKRTPETELLGHAWVECAGEIVTTDLASPASYIVLNPHVTGLNHESHRRNPSL